MPIGKSTQDHSTHCEFIEFPGKIALRYDSLCGKMAEGKMYVAVRNDILQERRNKRLIYSALYLEERKLKMLLKQTI